MERDEKIVVGIVMILMSILFVFAYNAKDNPSELAKAITQGIECLKYDKNCDD